MKFNKLSSLILGGVFAMALIGCSSDDPITPPTPDPDPVDGRKYFNVVVSTSTDGNTATYVQALTAAEISDPNKTITVIGNGYEVPSVRTARVASSDDGTWLYNLSYGGGTIQNYEVKGGSDYAMVSELDFSPFVGTDYARWTRIDDKNALIHNVLAGETAIVLDADGEYAYHNSSANILTVHLNAFTFGAPDKFDMPRSEYDNKEKVYIGRIDNPAIVGGKAYYGLSKSKYNPRTGKSYSSDPKEAVNNNYYAYDYPATSLVVDYPSLKNPKVIESGLATGSNYGYRMPVAHAYDNSVYQVASRPGHLLKITDGAYDDTFDFDLAEKLGMEAVGALGWFHVGGGIGYLLYYDNSEGKGSSSAAKAWSVARVDVTAKTAIRMNLSNELYLWQYQGAVADNGKLYMTLAPVGKEGNVYIFDSANDTADGFTVGAKLVTGGGISYIGVF